MMELVKRNAQLGPQKWKRRNLEVTKDTASLMLRAAHGGDFCYKHYM